MVYLHANFHMCSASASFFLAKTTKSNFGRFVMLFYIVETVPLKELHDFRKSITVHHFRATIFCHVALTLQFSRVPYF
jgi:hypothetical protein